MKKNRISVIKILLTVVIVLSFCGSAFTQGNKIQIDSTKAFIAVLKITIPDSLKISSKDWYPKLLKEQYEVLIKRNSDMLSHDATNTVWPMDTVIQGSRFNATVYSGITSRVIRKKIEQNSIFLYSPKNSGENRVINGIVMYLWENDSGMVECIIDDELFEKPGSEK